MIHKHSLILNCCKVLNTEKSKLCNTATGTIQDAVMLLLLCRPRRDAATFCTFRQIQE